MKNKSARAILIQNVIKGKIAEEIAKQDYLDHGYDLQETGTGSDFIATKKMGDKIYTEYVDVKSGRAKLTKKQKQTRDYLRKEKTNYSIYRVTNEHLEFQIKNNSKLQEFNYKSNSVLSQFTGNFIIQDSTNCPSCGLSAIGLDEIVSKFGLRNMGNKTVRIQSWCRHCRDCSRRGQK